MNVQQTMRGTGVNFEGYGLNNITLGLSLFYKTFPFKELTPRKPNRDLIPQQNKTIAKYCFDAFYNSREKEWGKGLYHVLDYRIPLTVEEIKKHEEGYPEHLRGFGQTLCPFVNGSDFVRIDVPNDEDRFSVQFRISPRTHPLKEQASYNHAKNLIKYVLEETSLESSLEIITLNADWSIDEAGNIFESQFTKNTEQYLRAEINPHIGTCIFLNEKNIMFYHNPITRGGGNFPLSGKEHLSHLLQHQTYYAGGNFGFTERNPIDLTCVVTHPEIESWKVDIVKETFGKERKINERIFTI